MNEEASALLAPLLSLVGENIYLQALIPLILGIAAGWIFNNIIITNLKKLASKTTLVIDDHLFSLLQGPLFNSILLVGLSGSILILAQTNTKNRNFFFNNSNFCDCNLGNVPANKQSNHADCYSSK